MHLKEKRKKKFSLLCLEGIDTAGAELEKCFEEPAHSTFLFMLIC